ncbi:hypothetical protein AGMMS49960_17660 [Betaproteobacteria bacterium]|nr:hypothetical protein AGMMS49543_03790 [Betaproteobacteria bacterium]GHU03381.1 hypothetical protein AGMMS49960_17660 [Betaproteobacteria bacterium]GHU17838.1 hypothetical protein AGMMS50243_06760 [Betaproteobacteria bacterium]
MFMWHVFLDIAMTNTIISQVNLLAMSFLAVGLMLAGHADAQVFKCKDDKTGKIIYSGTPCPTTTTGNAIHIQSNTIETDDADRERLNQQIRTHSERNAPQQRAVEQVSSSDYASKEACKQAQRSYELEAGSIKKDKSAIAAKKVAYQKACSLPFDSVPIEPAHRREVAIPAAPRPTVITGCDSGGCWDNVGGRYNSAGGDVYTRPGGGPACHMIGGQMVCN